MSGRQLEHIVEQRARRGDVAIGEILVERDGIQLTKDARLEDGFDLGAEYEAPTVPVVVQRLLAETVAGGQQTPAVVVPDCDGEHPAQMLHAVVAILFVGMHDGFGIAVCAEAVTPARQFFAQLAMVVDLAVEDDQDALIFIEDWLASAGHIYDRKSAHAQRNAVAHPDALLVWTAMANHRAHALDELLCAFMVALRVNESGYSAHVVPTLVVPRQATPSVEG